VPDELIDSFAKNRGQRDNHYGVIGREPIAGVLASVSMMIRGGLEAITLSLASEYAKQQIRFNTVAPGVVDTRSIKTRRRTS
jgi:NAD(P)-dependent dehydrogenase (short-subunit alcohol dehydrogenase family)